MVFANVHKSVHYLHLNHEVHFVFKFLIMKIDALLRQMIRLILASRE